ncbi:hypothetical protein J3E69DRAFT_361631 [Trichoderma sp. SZMC 28015]
MVAPVNVLKSRLAQLEVCKRLNDQAGVNNMLAQWKMADTIKKLVASQQGLTPSERELKGIINSSAYKEGISVVYDCRNIQILYTAVDNVFGKNMDKMSKALANYLVSQTMTEQQRRRLLQRACNDDLPTVGVEHAHIL